MGDVTQQGENARTELFYKSKLSLTPKRKVSFRLGGSEDFAREEEKNLKKLPKIGNFN